MVVVGFSIKVHPMPKTRSNSLFVIAGLMAGCTRDQAVYAMRRRGWGLGLSSSYVPAIDEMIGSLGVDPRKAGIFQQPVKAAMRLPGSLTSPAHGGSWVDFGRSSVFFLNPKNEPDFAIVSDNTTVESRRR